MFVWPLISMRLCHNRPSWGSADSLKKLERLGAEGEGDNRRWDGWMASLTWWIWVWVNSGSWWWTGRPGMLWFMGSQRVKHDWVTELNPSSGIISAGSQRTSLVDWRKANKISNPPNGHPQHYLRNMPNPKPSNSASSSWERTLIASVYKDPRTNLFQQVRSSRWASW